MWSNPELNLGLIFSEPLREPMSSDAIPVRIVPHTFKGNSERGSFEVRFGDEIPGQFFHWDEGSSHASVTRMMSRRQALEAAKRVARASRDELKWLGTV